MNMSAQPLINYADVNHYQVATQWAMSAGNAASLYFQIIDLNQNSLRIMGSVQVTATFSAVDPTQVITKHCYEEITDQDSSIWYIPLLPTDNVNGGNVSFSVLFSDGNTYQFTVNQMLALSPVGNNVGGC